VTTFFSVDVETSGLTPANGLLLTVGIQPVAYNGEAWALSAESLYVRIDRSAHLAVTDHWKPGVDTHDWWAQQSDEARAEAWEDRGLVRHSDTVAARMVAEFVATRESHVESRVFVANPVAFDKMWVTTLFDDTGVADPFHYRSLCLRSMKYGLRPHSPWGSDREEHKPTLPHHALHDARAQALDLVAMLAERDGAQAA
jgi:hypothetical protein